MESIHITEILIEARQQELERVDVVRSEMIAALERRSGVRRVAATLLVRLALVLDREAAPGAAQFDRRTA